MIITDTKIVFKSSMEFFRKERDNLKCNTVRKLDDAEKRALNLWIESLRTVEPKIKIILQDWKEISTIPVSFERTLTDISEWEGVYIFSWKAK